MRPIKISIEQGLYLAALLLAAVVRFIALSRDALPNREAALALQSLHLIQKTVPVFGPHPGYLIPTALFDFLFGASNWTARFWPALAGVGLILVPYLLRERVGHRAALVLAFLIALDPGLSAVSRQADSVMIAMTLTLLALACLIERKQIWAGVFAGLALVSGPSLWPNLICIAGAWLIIYRNDLKKTTGLEPYSWGTIVASAVASMVVLGTFFMIFPAGLSAAAASLPAYFQSWSAPGGVPVLRLVGALCAYEVLGLVLGLAGLIRGLMRGDRLDQFLSIWWIAALLFALLNPSRQVNDLAWSLAPLLVLAARGLDRLLRLEDEILPALGQGGLILLLLLLIGNLVISWPSSDSSTQGQLYRILVLAVAVLLIIAESFLVVWGWSQRIGLYGLAWGVTGFLMIFSISTLGNAVGWSGRSPSELWRTGPSFASADLLVSTLEDHTQWRPNPSQSPEIVIVNLQSPALEWLLRDYPNLSIEKTLPASSKPEFLITPDQAKLDLAAAYTGQGFDSARSPSWDLIAPSEWINWLVYRSLKSDVWTKETIVLWVRSDLFPGVHVNQVIP